MRRLYAIIFLAGLLLPGVSPAILVERVSQTAAGIPGQADSGSVRGGIDMRPAAVLDDGSVFFVSLAPLTTADDNALVDYYRATAAGAVTAIALPTAQATSNFFWGGTDAVGNTFYLIRQLPDPSLFDLRYGTQVENSSLGFRSLIAAADFAAGGTQAVYTRKVSDLFHLFLHDFSGAVPRETQLTVGINGDCLSPAISSDGGRIVFSSSGTNLVPGDNNGLADVFLYEQTSGVFSHISQRLDAFAGAGAGAGSPDISADGQVICFTSADPGFVLGDTNASSDVFVSAADVITRCSVAADGAQADAPAASPRLNANGRFVVFTSTASTLAPGVGNSLNQVFLYDRDCALLEVISLATDGSPADADCLVPDISAAGRYVTFVSKATNVGPGASGAFYQVYRADRGPHYANHPPRAQNLALAAAQGTPIHFSLPATDADEDEIMFVLETLPGHGTLTDHAGNVLSLAKAYGADRFPWRYLPADSTGFTDSFSFRATDGKTPSAPNQVSIRMLDPELGALSRLSIATDGSEGTRDSYLPYTGLGISAEGNRVVFSSTANELAPADDDSGFADVFLRDTLSGTTRLLSAGAAQNSHAYRCVLSADGQTTLYYTEDGNKLILQDLASGARTTVDTVSSYLSNAALGISHDGNRVVYEKNGQVWLFEQGLTATAAVSVNNAGEAANASCADGAITPDGSAIVFSSTATNLDASNPDGSRSLYLRHLDDAQTILISTTQSGQMLPNAIKPTLSESGRYVAFLSDDGTLGDGIGTLYVKDLAKGVLQQIAENAATPAISADGRFLCYTKTGSNGRNQLYRADLAASPLLVLLVSNASGLEGNADSYRGVLSASGQFVAFAAKADNLVPADGNDRCDVFLNNFGLPLNGLPNPSPATLSTDAETPLVDVPLFYTDAEDNDVRTELVSAPAHAAAFTLRQRRLLQETATFSYVPLATYTGEDSFSYRCGDAQGWSAPITVTITIRPVNHPPRWTAMPALWALRDGQEFTIDLSRYVDDPDTSADDLDTFFFTLLQGAPYARIEGTLLILSAAAVADTTPIFLRIGVADHLDGPVVEFGEQLAIHLRPPVDIVLNAGWNLISFPMALEPSAAALLQIQPLTPGASSQPLGPVWRCAADTASYSRAATLEPGRAYWVFCTETASLSLQVAWEPPSAPQIDLATGWNLVGPVGHSDDATPPWEAIAALPFPRENTWTWNKSFWAYPEQQRLRWGQGYWIYSPKAQSLALTLLPVAN